MKVTQCEWAPSLVVEWLSGELEERGIPGPTYAHTLLSLLHTQYCSHPSIVSPNGGGSVAVPTAITAAATPTTAVLRHRRHSHQRHPRDLDPKHLDLEELLGDLPHPDADLPDLVPQSVSQRGGSRKARKRYKVRQKHRTYTLEQLQKVSALHCLMSASDDEDLQYYDLENLIDELCIRLKGSKEGGEDKSSGEGGKLTVTEPVKVCLPCIAGSEESGNDTDDSTPEHLAEKYYAAFPPLSGSCVESYTEETPWGSRNCLCVWDGNKPTHTNRCDLSAMSCSSKPTLHRKNCRNRKSSRDIICKREESERVSPLKQCVMFTLVGGKDVLAEDSSTAENSSEEALPSSRSKYSIPLIDDIPEGYIGDTSSRESSEDRDKSDQVVYPRKGKEDYGTSNHTPNQFIKQGIWEEWECTGSLVVNPKLNTACNDLQLAVGGGRLFERCSTSCGTSGCSSDAETNRITPRQPETEEETIRQYERKISDTSAQVWGRSNEVKIGQKEHVWDPPSLQDLAFYGSNDGTIGIKSPLFGNSAFNYIAGDFAKDFHKFSHLPSQAELNWYIKDSWFASNTSNLLLDSKNDQFFSNAFKCSPHTAIMGGKSEDNVTLVNFNNENMRSIWSDYNANNISGATNNEQQPCKLDSPELEQKLDNAVTTKENDAPDSESNLCKSFQQLGLQQLWATDAILSNVPEDSGQESFNYVSEVLNAEENMDQIKSDNEEVAYIMNNVCDSDSTTDTTNSTTLVMSQIPSGPSGPHVDLKHTESSGFSTVVPKGKSSDLVSSLQDNLLPGVVSSDNNVISPESNSTVQSNATDGNLELPMPCQEEENLLTSPRTHFKPIHHNCIGNKPEGRTEDASSNAGGFQPPELEFQRTESGALYLESDLLEGSPKKYMVYREPEKIPQVDLQDHTETRNVNAIPFVPKFKVVNNEKFSQTELNQDHYRVAYKQKKMGLNLKCIGHEIRNSSKQNIEQQPDVFEFQQQDFPGLSCLAEIWKSESPPKETANSIWKMDCKNKSEKSGHEWFKEPLPHFVDWSVEENFETQEQNNKSSYINTPDDDTTTDWASYLENRFGELSSTAITDIKALWPGNITEIIPSTSNPKDDNEDMFTIKEDRSDPSAIPGKRLFGLGVSSEKDPWSSNDGQNTSLSWSTLSYNNDTKRPSDITRSASSYEDGFQHLDMQSSVAKDLDVETDELLEGLFTHSNIFSNKVTTGKPSSQNSWLTKALLPSSVNENSEETASAAADPPPIAIASNWSEDEQVLLQEDLDNLEPGWELNDGFEWDTPHDDEEVDSEYGGDLWLYEAEDGSTVMVPVEYMDDNYYDEIFGSPLQEPMGGSLPDLPSGELMSVRFSNQLEEEWKKTGIPYKVQLPKKCRGGRWVPPSRRPCSFFMEGNCRKPDCKFSHDLASITCRFWEEGSCLKGITCPFLHGYPLRRKRNRSEGSRSRARSESDNLEVSDQLVQESTFEIDSEADFPSLGTSLENKRLSVGDDSSALSSSVGSNSSSIKVNNRKKRKFITVAKNVMFEVSGERGKLLRRRAAQRRQKRHHLQAEEGDVPGSEQQQLLQQKKKSQPTPIVLKKLERHRASASGHDDGTVSDY